MTSERKEPSHRCQPEEGQVPHLPAARQGKEHLDRAKLLTFRCAAAGKSRRAPGSGGLEKDVRLSAGDPWAGSFAVLGQV